MGQFSWFTQDDHSQIVDDKKADVYMVDPRDGTVYKETCYKGYGVFGGRDFYELLADMNKDIVLRRNDHRKEKFDGVFSKDYKILTADEQNVKRNAGLSLWFNFIEPDDFSLWAPRLQPEERVMCPILVRDLSQWEKFKKENMFNHGHPDSDPDQGWA